MIYKMIKDNLVSLENQWGSLVDALKALDAKLPADDVAKKPVPPNPASPTLQKVIDASEAEKGKVSAERGQINDQLTANELIVKATEIFRESDLALRVGIGVNIAVATTFNDTLFKSSDAADDQVEVTFCRTQLSELESFVTSGIEDLAEISSDEGKRFNIQGIRRSVDNLSSYPMLTTDLGSGGAAMPSSSATSNGGNSLQRAIDGAMREVLGRLPKRNDTRSFLASLSQSFSITAIEGHVEVAWTPRSFAGQTDLGGGVTGAQASLYARGKVALDNALPLLDGLYPLLPDPDLEEVEAARSIVRSELIEIVNELGLEGGPRVPRVDTLFNLLLSQKTTGIDNQIILGGKLSYLEEVLGLKDEKVNTLEEETNFTNFIVLRDYINSLKVSWDNFRAQFSGRDLGTKMVQLSRALSVSSETVGEIYAAMDSVFIGASERQVAAFRLEGGKSTMLVAELLSWVVTFTSEEAPRLVYEGGRRGIEAIIPTAKALEDLVSQFLSELNSDPGLPVGLRHPRVQHPLQELRAYLHQVQTLAEEVQKPAKTIGSFSI